MRVENLNKNILKRAADNLEEPIISKFPKLNEWIEGAKFPTFNQLIAFSKAANIPFGYLFLNDLPEKEYPIPHYRTNNNTFFKPSKNLIETLESVQEKQVWAKDILIDLGVEPLEFAGKSSINDSVEKTALLISNLLDLSELWANNLTRWSDSLRILIEKTENAGIFVVVNGVVNNNTRRKLDTNEFRGFVLYDPIAPFVFVNGKDSISGKIFTLVHEIVHVLVGSTASFDLKKLRAGDNEIEQFCDKVTAEFLVPSKNILSFVESENDLNFNELAKIFKVSQIVIARRLLALEIISLPEYFSFYDNYIKSEFKVAKNKGGNFHNSAPYKISRRFFNLIDTSVKQNKIRYRDAFRLTGLRAKTYDEYLKRQNS